MLAHLLPTLIDEQRVVGDQAVPGQPLPAHVALLVGGELEPGPEGQGAQLPVAVVLGGAARERGDLARVAGVGLLTQPGARTQAGGEFGA
ncbi:hypothetical protein D3C71_1525630 [compost metagenome]